MKTELCNSFTWFALSGSRLQRVDVATEKTLVPNVTVDSTKTK